MDTIPTHENHIWPELGNGGMPIKLPGVRVVVTFKAYLDNIQAKTGISPDNFWSLAQKHGFVKNGKLVAAHAELLRWLKSDVGLGHGHANAMILYLRIRAKDPRIRGKKLPK